VKFLLTGAHGFFHLVLGGFSTLNLVSLLRFDLLLSSIIHYRLGLRADAYHRGIVGAAWQQGNRQHLCGHGEVQPT
jgi:hypothetical protein